MHTLTCPACKARTLTTPYRGGLGWYSRCDNCQSIAILEPSPPKYLSGNKTALADHPYRVTGLAVANHQPSR